MSNVKSVFQDKDLDELYEILCSANDGIESQVPFYKMMNDDLFQMYFITDPKAANFVYVYEILERLHWGATSSILRCKKWLDGLINSIISNNFILFSSCFRGLLESAGDSIYTFEKIPISEIDKRRLDPNYDFNYKVNVLPLLVTNYYDLIVNTLKGENENIKNTLKKFEMIENRLINFSFARQSHSSTPYTSKAEQNRDVYISRKANEYVNLLGVKIENQKKGLFNDSYELYSLLCEYVHASSDSTMYFFENFNNAYRFNTKSDEKNINQIMKKYKELLRVSIESQVILPIIILKVVNSFGLKQLFTNNLFEISLDTSHTWSNINEIYKIKVDLLREKYHYSDYANVPNLNEYSKKFRQKIGYHKLIGEYEERDLYKNMKYYV